MNTLTNEELEELEEGDGWNHSLVTDLIKQAKAYNDLAEALTQIRIILEGAKGTLAEGALEIAKEALNGKKP